MDKLVRAYDAAKAAQAAGSIIKSARSSAASRESWAPANS